MSGKLEVSADTLQGVMGQETDAMSLVATIRGTEYELGLKHSLPHDKKSLDLGDGQSAAIRFVYLWRLLGGDTNGEPLFPAVAYSSLKKAFFVLTEGLCLNANIGPIIVESVRRATPEEAESVILAVQDDELEQLLRS